MNKKPLPSSIPRTNKLLKTDWGDIKYQAWGLGDQSNLLLALSGEPDHNDFYDALREILESCVIDYSGGEVHEMPLFLSEFVLVNARAISIGEVADLAKACDCEGKPRVNLSIDLKAAKIVSDDSIKDTYTIGDYTFKLRYPSFRGTLEISNLVDASSITEDLLRKFVESVYTEDEVWVMSDYSRSEQNEFMKLLGSDFQLHVMNKFVKFMPYVSMQAVGKCDACGKVHDQEIKGISRLFNI